MENASEIIRNALARVSTPKPHAPKYPRQEQIVKFLERLNPSRVEKKMRPLTYSRLAGLFEKVPDSDLYWLYRTCEEANVFGSMFWYLVKKKEV